MEKIIAVLPGDGVGPETINQAIKVIKKIASISNHNFKLEYGLIGNDAIEKKGIPLPNETLLLCQKSQAVLFGAIGDPKYDLNPNSKTRPEIGLLELRKKLGLSINIRPIRVYRHLSSISPIKNERLRDVDFIVVRELTGGIYFGLPRERRDKGNTAIDTSIYTKDEIIKVSEYAFNLARKRKKKLTSVDKANVLETSRLWRETVTKIGRKYPEVTLEHMFVDNASMQIIKNPSHFDVILTENMFGDILTDEASVITGSIGMLPSASIGEKNSLFEPIHGAFNKAKGKNIANPIGNILSTSLMFQISFNMIKESALIEQAVDKALNKGYRTRDISNSNTPEEKILGTKEMGNLIVSYL